MQPEDIAVIGNEEQIDLAPDSAQRRPAKNFRATTGRCGCVERESVQRRFGGDVIAVKPTVVTAEVGFAVVRRRRGVNRSGCGDVLADRVLPVESAEPVFLIGLVICK